MRNPRRGVSEDVISIVADVDILVIIFLVLEIRISALKRSMESESSTQGKKKMCLERSPSVGNAWQVLQEAGLAIAAAACSAAR